jgi:TonB family protein
MRLTNGLKLRLLLSTAAFAVAAGAALAAETASTAMYDIPAEPLDAALNAYIAASGAQVFYETALSAGRRSTPVRGRFTAEAALQTLLLGTGLVDRRADVDAFVITWPPRGQQQPGLSATAIARDDRFVSAVQAGILGALCGHPEIRPGGYRVALELWISPAGAVQRAELIGSTGDAARDAALQDALQEVAIEAAPPADMPQPIVMTVAPRPPGETGDCASPP